jgi:hypothetical protein
MKNTFSAILFSGLDFGCNTHAFGVLPLFLLTSKYFPTDIVKLPDTSAIEKLIA